MDLIGEERGRAARAATWLQATRAELVGLAVLLSGALVVTGVVVWQALDRPSALPGTTAGDLAAGAAGMPAGGAGAAGAHDPNGEPHHSGDPEDAVTGGGPPLDGPAADAPAGEVVVHVSGAVAEAGVVTLPAGARVADAVAAAGGVVDGAELAAVNLARLLTDGEHVHVPREGEAPPPSDAAPGGPSAGADGGTVDLNRAGAAELETLPGIGPALAQRIIAHREQHGPFREVGQLRDVSGIGEKRFQDLAPLVTVG